MKLAPGNEVVAYCSRCDLKLSHIIMAMKSESVIAKVQCKTCQSIHAFKALKKSPVVKKAPRRTNRHHRPAAEVWGELMNQTTTTQQDYSTDKTFQVGDKVAHPSFGTGFVQRTVDTTKIEVVFQADVKTLVHNIK